MSTLEVCAGLLLVVAAAAGVVARARARLRDSRAEVAALTAERRAYDEQARQAIAQRNALVRAAVQIAPNLPAGALRDALDLALRSAGLELISADGLPFDARVHRIVERRRTADPALHDRVAVTVRRGYRDGSYLLRPADVVVHQHVPVTAPQEDPP